MTRVEFKNRDVIVVGNLYVPDNFDESKQYPALVVCHPAGGVKEQTAGTYAAEMAKHGFVTLAFDASYQGESSGEPRQMENPYIRVEDNSAALDFLTTLPYVDNNRIGALGVCAGGGYVSAAAMRDRRFKAVGTVSAVNIGEGFRYSWGGHETPESQNLIALLENVGATRTAQVNGGELVYVPLTPQSKEGITLPDMLEAIEYYWTPRANHPRAVSKMLLVDLAQQATFDAFHLTERFLTQPLMIVAGTAANTLWFSEDLYRRAAAKDKTLHLVEGATHIAMYDIYVPQVIEALAPFFKRTL